MPRILQGCGRLAVLLLLLPAARQAEAQATAGEQVIVRAVRTTAPIRVDGRLDEAAWAQAPEHDQFIQRDPDEGQPASDRTVGC